MRAEGRTSRGADKHYRKRARRNANTRVPRRMSTEPDEFYKKRRAVARATETVAIN